MARKNRTMGDAELIRVGAAISAFDVLSKRLEMMNKLIFTYSKAIKDMQTVGHGSIVPHLQVCKKDGCLGCFHVRWKRWYDPLKDQRKRQRMFGKKMGEVDRESRFLAKDISNPLQVMPRGEEYRDLRETIKALESVLSQRKDLVRHLTNALRCSARFDE